MSGIEDENQEHLLKWVIRYVLIPVSLAVITGFFALEVINREIASRQQPEENITEFIFATMTAAAPQTQSTPTPAPSSIATSEATEEANLPGTRGPIAELPGETTSPSGQTDICGQIPAGWRLYTVQPGNTLFSLAQQADTTVAIIQQANCLYGTLKAFEQIWLPAAISEPVEVTAVVEETAVVDPVITVTPPITFTEPVSLPDLMNRPGSVPEISVSCPDGPGSCVTSVNLAVSNLGTADADFFNVQVWLDPAQSVVLNQIVERLLPGESAAFLLVSPAGGNCYDPNCTVCISVDSRNGVVEADETNNLFCTTFPG